MNSIYISNCDEQLKHCNNCGKSGVSSRCGGCQNVYYCNKQCQSKHWKHHKRQCKLIQAKNNWGTGINIDKLMKFRNPLQLTHFENCLKQFMDESNPFNFTLNTNIKESFINIIFGYFNPVQAADSAYQEILEMLYLNNIEFIQKYKKKTLFISKSNIDKLFKDMCGVMNEITLKNCDAYRCHWKYVNDRKPIRLVLNILYLLCYHGYINSSLCIQYLNDDDDPTHCLQYIFENKIDFERVVPCRIVRQFWFDRVQYPNLKMFEQQLKDISVVFFNFLDNNNSTEYGCWCMDQSVFMYPTGEIENVEDERMAWEIEQRRKSDRHIEQFLQMT